MSRFAPEDSEDRDRGQTELRSDVVSTSSKPEKFEPQLKAAMF